MKNTIKKFKDYLIINGYSNFTYLYAIKQLMTKIKSISETNFNQFLLKNSDKYSAETLNVYIKAVNVFSKFSGKKINTPKLYGVTKKIPDFLIFEFVEKEIIPIVENGLFKKHKLRNKVCLQFMYYAGLRKSETYLLQRKNFNLKEGIFKFYIPKTDREKIIPLNDKMIKLLQEYFNSEPEVNNAFNLNKGSIEYIFKLLKPNFPGIKLRPHLFRHSCATHLLKKKFNLKEVQDWLGHADIKTTMRYVGTDIEHLKDKVRRNL